jgi:CubicO group peptidase (beta-lactamase class C family)
MNEAIGTTANVAARVDRVIDDAIGTKRIVGAVVLVARNGALVHHRAAGFADREAGRPMTEDTIFRFASISKPLTSTAALALIDRGKMRLDDPVTRFLPEFQPKLPDGGEPQILIRDLLTHTSGLGYASMQPPDGPYAAARISDGLDQPGVKMEENLRRLVSVPLHFEPGTAWMYGMSTDVLGWAVARAHGGTLGEAISDHVSSPLGMKDTGFRVTDPARLSVSYADGEDEPVRMQDLDHVVPMPDRGGQLTFSPARNLDETSYHSGGAGMVGTAPDFIRLLEALRTGGGTILKPATVEQASRNQIGDLPRTGPRDAGWRFGLLSSILDDPVTAATPQSVGTLQWGGVYGHQWFVDRPAGLSVAIFTNTAVHGLFAFPPLVRDAIYGVGQA